MFSLLNAVRKIEPSCVSLIPLQTAYTNAGPEGDHMRASLETGKVVAQPDALIPAGTSYARALEMSLV